MPGYPPAAKICPTFESLFVKDGRRMLFTLFVPTYGFYGRFFNVNCPVFVVVGPPLPSPDPESVGEPFLEGELL